MCVFFPCGSESQKGEGMDCEDLGDQDWIGFVGKMYRKTQSKYGKPYNPLEILEIRILEFKILAFGHWIGVREKISMYLTENCNGLRSRCSLQIAQ